MTIINSPAYFTQIQTRLKETGDILSKTSPGVVGRRL